MEHSFWLASNFVFLCFYLFADRDIEEAERNNMSNTAVSVARSSAASSRCGRSCETSYDGWAQLDSRGKLIDYCKDYIKIYRRISSFPRHRPQSIKFIDSIVPSNFILKYEEVIFMNMYPHWSLSRSFVPADKLFRKLIKLHGFEHPPRHHCILDIWRLVGFERVPLYATEKMRQRER